MLTMDWLGIKAAETDFILQADLSNLLMSQVTIYSVSRKK